MISLSSSLKVTSGKARSKVRHHKSLGAAAFLSQSTAARRLGGRKRGSRSAEKKFPAGALNSQILLQLPRFSGIISIEVL
jgi:hypothetical protein